MAHITSGYLFDRKKITYENESFYVYEFIDYATALIFNNDEEQIICNIIDGKAKGEYAYLLGNEEGEAFVYLDESTEDLIKESVEVDYIKLRKIKIKDRSKYYIKKDKTLLISIHDKNLINYLEKINNKKEYDEKELDESSDIASIYSYVKKTIISQDEQIMQILTSLYKNQKVINSDLDDDIIAKLKENILIYGPTGTGKTEIIKRIAKIYDIPMVIEDATSLSETGYVGRKITDMLEDLYLTSDSNMEKAEKGILAIDEFDKLAEKDSNSESHVSREGVQRSLLKLLDGSEFYINEKKFDTSKLTIIGIGAFTGIANDKDYKQITTDDFINYGVMRELMGRFSKLVPMNELTKEDIIKILKESNFSPINTYKKLFEILNINYEFDDEFIEYIAQLAVEKKSGARSLKTVFDSCISSALFSIFAGEYSNIKLIKPEENEKPYVLTKK